MTELDTMVLLPSEPDLIGHQLRTLRQEKGLTLEEVSHSTRISLTNLCAIESMQYQKLPADPFTKGLLGLYGAFLGTDGRKIAEEFFLERDGGRTAVPSLKKYLAHRSLAPKELAERAHISSATIAGILMALITLSFTGFCLYTSWNPLAFLTSATKNPPATTIGPFHPADPSSGNGLPGKVSNLDINVLKNDRIFIAMDNNEPIPPFHTQETEAHENAGQSNRLKFSRWRTADRQITPSPDLPLLWSGGNRFLLSLPVLPFNQ
jgi:cytoskeleton protein RodZ